MSLSILLQNSSIFAAPIEAPAAGTSPPAKVETLTMAFAIAKAIRNNPTLCSRRLQQELNEISYDDAWRRMWLPAVTVGLTSGAAYTLAQVPSGTAAADAGGNAFHGQPPAAAPLSGVQLNVGTFNLYNFGKDRDALRSAELEIERSHETLREVERTVRFAVIKAVFNFKTRQDLLDAAQRSVDSSEAIYELVKSRVPLHRASNADVSSAEIDLLNAKSILLQNQTSYSQSLWDLNLVLGDPIGHAYKVKTEVRFIKFRMPLDEVLSVYRANAPAIKDARKALEQRRAELRIAEKNWLPLPVVTFSGLTLVYNFTPTGTTPNRGDGNVNVGAAVALTVPLIGDGGFLFSRAKRAAEVKVESAELDLINAANSNEVQAMGLYTSLLQSETTVDLNQKIFKQSAEVFDGALATLQTKGAANRLDLKNALEQLRSSELTLTSSILDHYSLKLQLATLIGVDRFPEENL
ncbi:MAG: TolC family protein [Deltaproteobacteria bacterium]|nr:TolC family protein [Deltaproteobacteria bacterium]